MSFYLCGDKTVGGNGKFHGKIIKNTERTDARRIQILRASVLSISKNIHNAQNNCAI